MKTERKNNSKSQHVIQWLKNNKSGIGDFLFTWLPAIINIILCAVGLFPWGDIFNKQATLQSIIFDRDAIIAVILISYVVIIAKNNFDLSKKTIREIKKIQKFDADDFLIERDELEPLSDIFNEANKIQFSGGHLSTVIISNNQNLNNFLKTGHEVRFILPNPMNEYVIQQYAEKLMVNMTKEKFKRSVLLSLDTILPYIRNPQLKIKVRVYNTLPAFGLQIIEAPTGNRIYVELYTMQTELSNRLLFPIRQSDSGKMYTIFEEQFTTLWEDSQDIEVVPGLLNALKQSEGV